MSILAEFGRRYLCWKLARAIKQRQEMRPRPSDLRKCYLAMVDMADELNNHPS